MTIEILRDTPNGDMVEYDPTDDHADVELAIGDDWRVDWETTSVRTSVGRLRSPVSPTLSALIEADAEVGWRFGIDGHWDDMGLHRPSEVEAHLREWVVDGDWDRARTLFLSGYANPYHPADATHTTDRRHGIRVRVTLDPLPPKCAKGHEHDWRSPIEVVGGIAENPGVWGNGGGVTIHEVCAHCGAHKHTDTWAQDPETGEQGLRSVSYEDADEETTAWVASLAEEAP